MRRRGKNRLFRNVVWMPIALVACWQTAAARQDVLQERGFSKLPGYRSTSVTPKPGDKMSDLTLVVGPPLEETVDPEEYVVGANDIFVLVLGGTSDLPIPLVVTPDGVLLIPDVGEILVAGKTLKETKELVSAEVKKSYKIARSNLALVSPRQFIVTVLGSVRSPGPYVVTSTLRVDKVIALANLAAQLPVPNQHWTGDFSRRHVVLRRRGKPDRQVDIDLFYASNRKETNPTLMEGDVVIVPPRNIDQGSVSVYGAVNQPGQYEYRDYDSLWNLIRIASGLSQNANPTSVELTRFSPDGNSSKSQFVDLSRIMGGLDRDIPIENRDRIVVKEKIDRRRDFKVHVRGEVKYPGMYPISPDSTRLTEIIGRAGGFTEYAYLPAAEIERKQLTPSGADVNLTHEAMINLRMSDQIITPEQKAYYDLEAQLRRGTVAADFERLFNQNDLSRDVYLQDGDIIYIPNSTKTVYVYGQVPKPGYVAYKEGADLRYYVQLAGGYGEEAESGKTRVIKGKTREWRDPSDTRIEPGDYVWVPKEIKYPLSYYMNLFSQAASFVSVVLSMTVIIIQLTNK